MKLQHLILLFIICKIAFAQVDCTKFKTQETCIDTNCDFTSLNKSCTSKCNSLTVSDCANGDALTNCKVSNVCKPKFSRCNEAKNETQCKSLDQNCYYQKEEQVKCLPNHKLINQCYTYQNKDECNTDSQCEYIENEFDKCSQKEKLCQNDGSCPDKYCVRIDTRCVIEGPDCSVYAADETSCKQNSLCIMNKGSCEYDTDRICGLDCNKDGCSKTNCIKDYSNYTCEYLDTDEQCKKNVHCFSSLRSSCQPKNTLCQLTNCDLTLCEKTEYLPPLCYNGDDEFCSRQDPSNCGTQCEISTICADNQQNQCVANPTSKNQCTGYCTFTDNGACKAKVSDDKQFNDKVDIHNSYSMQLTFTSFIIYSIFF